MLNQLSVEGMWAESAHHINLLELMAVQKVLLHFALLLRGKHGEVR